MDMQRRCCRSSWSGLGRTTFQRVVCLVPRLHQHPSVANYTCIYDVQLLAIWHIPLLAVVLRSQSSPTRRPIAETSHQPLSFLFPKRPFGQKNIVYSQVGLLLGRGCTTMKPPTLLCVICAQKPCVKRR